MVLNKRATEWRSADGTWTAPAKADRVVHEYNVIENTDKIVPCLDLRLAACRDSRGYARPVRDYAARRSHRGGAPQHADQRCARRFYATATTAAVPDGYAVRLDDKPVRTPARRVLAAPTLALAEAIAAEWQAQQDVIDPAKMPLTRLANSIIDGVADAPRPVADEIAKYLGVRSLVLSRRRAAGAGRAPGAAIGIRSSTGRAHTLGADFKLGEGVVYVAQPQAALAAARAAIPEDPWRLGAVHVASRR